MSEFDSEKFKRVSVEAVLASMEVIRPFVIGLKGIGDIQIKGGQGTSYEVLKIQTVVDKKSEDVGKEILQGEFPNIPFVGEETGVTGKGGNIEFWYDPLDGTAPFTIGAPTSTVICAAYDKINKRLLAVTIGEPAYRRIWTATDGNGCNLMVYNHKSDLIHSKKCQVWEGDVNKGTCVFCDFTQGFARDNGKRQILTDAQAARLNDLLGRKTRLQLYGSNGIHQALVANGNEKVVGAITTAMGGSWDAAGALLVKEAGGAGAAFQMTKERKLIFADPLDPMGYDILVVANNRKTLEFLHRLICIAT